MLADKPVGGEKLYGLSNAPGSGAATEAPGLASPLISPTNGYSIKLPLPR